MAQHDRRCPNRFDSRESPLLRLSMTTLARPRPVGRGGNRLSAVVDSPLAAREWEMAPPIPVLLPSGELGVAILQECPCTFRLVFSPEQVRPGEAFETEARLQVHPSVDAFLGESERERCLGPDSRH